MATSVLGLGLGKLGKLELAAKLNAHGAKLKTERENAALCSVLKRRNESAGEFFTAEDVFQSKGIIETIKTRVPKKDWPELKPQHEDIPDDDHFERAATTIDDRLTSDFINGQQADIAGQTERIEAEKAAYHRDLRANGSRKRTINEIARDYVSAMNKIKQSDWSEAVKLAEQKRTTEEYSARAKAYLAERPVRPLDPSIFSLNKDAVAKRTWKMESRDWDREGGRKVSPIMVDKKGVCHLPTDEY